MTTYDFDLHGIVGIRLLDATERDLAKVQRQLGPIRARLERDPDITVRFVDRLPLRSLTWVGLGDTAFDEEHFVVTAHRGVQARTVLPFDRAGAGLELLCERTVPAVPHLLALINLSALEHGVLPMHASAFSADDKGVLVTGWAKGGKTESLLGCIHAGARYIGDEWVYLTRDGDMFGLPEPIRLWDWQLRQWQDLLAARPRAERIRLSGWRTLAATTRAVGGSGLPGAGLARKGAPVLARQSYLQIPPTELFGTDRVLLRGRLDAVVLVMSHESPQLTVERAGPRELSDRMRASLIDERAPFMAHYRQFRFAFPDRWSPMVETAAQREEELLRDLFDHRPAMKVMHPHPCDIHELGRVVRQAADQVDSMQPSHDAEQRVS